MSPALSTPITPPMIPQARKGICRLSQPKLGMTMSGKTQGPRFIDIGEAHHRVSSSSSSSSSSGSGIPLHLLKFIVNPESYEKLANDPNVSDPLTTSDFYVAQYADHYFEYDSQRRVTKESVQGGSRTYSFSYSQSAFADGYNLWKYKTVETLPDGDQNIIYSNYAGQTMFSVFKSGDDEWLEFWKYDSSGRAILHANPSALTGYDEAKSDLLDEQSGNYQYMRDSDGFIDVMTYDSDSGYISVNKIKKGEFGTEIKLREHEYTTCCIEVPAASSSSSSSSSSTSSSSGCGGPARYLKSKETVYPSDTDQTKKLITTYSYIFYSGSCATKQLTTTLPVVGTDQNGSGIAATRKDYFDTFGNLLWSMDERGFITRFKYDIVSGRDDTADPRCRHVAANRSAGRMGNTDGRWSQFGNRL